MVSSSGTEPRVPFRYTRWFLCTCWASEGGSEVVPKVVPSCEVVPSGSVFWVWVVPSGSGRGCLRHWIARPMADLWPSEMPWSLSWRCTSLTPMLMGNPSSSSRWAIAISLTVQPRCSLVRSRMVMMSSKSSTTSETVSGTQLMRVWVRLRVRPSSDLSRRYTMSTSSFLAEEPRWPCFFPPSLPAWSVRTQATLARFRLSPVVLANSR